MIGGPSGRPSSTDEAADQAEGTGGAVSSGSSSSSSDETDRNDEASSSEVAGDSLPRVCSAAAHSSVQSP